MKVPVSLRIAALAVATTGFYTYVGQLVPQKEWVQTTDPRALAPSLSDERQSREAYLRWRTLMDALDEA